MATLSVPPLVLAGITLYVGLNHLLIYRARRIGREHLTFAISCFAITAYDLFTAGLYGASSAGDAAPWQRGQLTALSLLAVSITWFFADYTRIVPARWKYLFSLYGLGSAVITITERAGLVLRPSVPALRQITLPWLPEASYVEASLGPAALVQIIMCYIMIAYFTAISFKYLRSSSRNGIPLLATELLFSAAVINDTLIKAGLLESIYVIEYAYLGVVLLMTSAISRRIAEASNMKDRLEESEARLIAEKERLFVTLRSIGDAVIATDTESRITHMNCMAEQMTGWKEKECLGHPIEEVFAIADEKGNRQDTCLISRALKAETTGGIPYEAILISRDGTQRTISDVSATIRDREGNVFGAVLVFRDLSAQKQLEQTLSNVERLESLGVVAGGVAHDFNNLLTGIFGLIDLALVECRTSESCESTLEDAMKHIDRARSLTLQLLSHTKDGTPSKEITVLSAMIQEIVKFVLSGTNVAQRLEIADDLWHAEIDRHQITQVLENLLLNACQAMPEGGTITVQAQNLPSPPGHLPLRNTPYVRIAVTDEGGGIAPDHLPRIFDPFFTTKEQGSGLGLASAFSIVTQHNGYLDVDSRLGIGSTFHIYLPACRPEGFVTSATIVQAPERRAVLVGLNPGLLPTIRNHLQTLGFDSVAWGSSNQMSERVNRYREQQMKVHLCMITREALERAEPSYVATMRRLQPGMRLIMLTEKKIAPREHSILSASFDAILTLPLSDSTLQEMLHTAVSNA